MHQAGALVLKELIVFVRSRVPCNDQYSGRFLRSRLQVMGGSVRQTAAASSEKGQYLWNGITSHSRYRFLRSSLVHRLLTSRPIRVAPY